MVGAKAGPALQLKSAYCGTRKGDTDYNGATVKKARALPREAALQMSEMRAPLFPKGAAANIPPKNLKIMMDAVFLERAHPTWKPCDGCQLK
jgi:hypothetical protein